MGPSYLARARELDALSGHRGPRAH